MVGGVLIGLAAPRTLAGAIPGKHWTSVTVGGAAGASPSTEAVAGVPAAHGHTVTLPPALQGR